MRSRPPQSSQSIAENNAAAPKIQINVLGKFKLTRGEVPVTARELSAAKKPQMLLMALISRGGEDVVVDLLIEDLWPDASPQSGKRNIRVVVHRLRKLLGHSGGRDSPYLSFERNRVSLNRSGVSLDIDEFLSYCKCARRAEQTGDLKGAVDFGNSAIELYKGDYLEDELYAPWAMPKREEFHSLYRDVLRRTASLYEQRGNARKSIELYKRLIKADPVFEEAYRKLMLLYSNIGVRAEAVRVYEECKRVLDREVGVDPDLLTTSLYRRIVENGRPTGKTKALDITSPSSYTPGYLADKILTTRGTLEGERKIVTVMFANVADSSAVFGNLDPEAVHEIMDGCFRLLLDAVHRFEGTVNQFLVGGVMALFGAPLAHEDHAQRACHAALAIQSILVPYAEDLKGRYGIDFKMRIGLNSGPVVVGAIGNDLRMDYTAQGDTVNLAKSMENSAEPGAILVTDHLHKLARDFFEFESIPTVQPGEKEEAGEAYRLIKPTGVETRFGASVARGLTRFVGRTREMKALNEAFDKARSGEGRVVGIGGEAGAGKSRLLLEFRSSLPRGQWRYLEGRCFHYGESMPYLPVLDVLRSYIGVKEGEQEQIVRRKLKKRILGLDRKLGNILAPLQELLSLEVEDEHYAKLDPKRKREKTFEAIRDLLTRGSRVRPIVLAIEDLHWIDRTTEELLDHIIEWIPEARILLILLYRNEYVPEWGGKSCYTEIRVGQLSTSRGMELVAAILHGRYVAPELGELILGKSAGNPFFMEELTHAMLEEGSIQRRGDSFFLSGNLAGIKVPDSIQGVITARMDRLEESLKRIVQTAAVIGREFAFRILETISEVKEGLMSGLDTLQKLEYIYRKGLFPELEYIFRHALTREVAYNSMLSQRRKEIHGLTGKAIEELYPHRLEEFYEMLAWHYSHSDNQDKAVRFLKLSAQKAAGSNSHREAFRLFNEALEFLAHMPQTAEIKRDRMDIILTMAGSMRPLGYPEDSIERLREGEALANELGDRKALANFFGYLGNYYQVTGTDLVLAKAYIEKEFSASELIGDVDIFAPAGFDLAIACTITSDSMLICEVAPKCIKLIEKTGTQSETFGRPYHIYPVLIAQYGCAEATLGNFEQGESIFEDCYRFVATNRVGNPYTLTLIDAYRGPFYIFKGDGKKAVEHYFTAAKRCEEAQSLLILGHFWGFVGTGYLLLGQQEKAVEYLEKGLKLNLDNGVTYWLGCSHAYLAYAHLQLGDRAKALAHAETAVKLSRANNERFFESLAEMYLGKVVGAGGPTWFDEAKHHILRGIDTAEELKLKPLAAEGHFHLGELSASSGRTKEAIEHLRKAETMFRQMGMEYWLGKAQDALAKL